MGIRQTKTTFASHAESFRFFGIPIPEDDQLAARRLVPDGATIVSEHSTPADWTSFVGFIGNIFWFHQTSIAGEKR